MLAHPPLLRFLYLSIRGVLSLLAPIVSPPWFLSALVVSVALLYHTSSQWTVAAVAQGEKSLRFSPW